MLWCQALPDDALVSPAFLLLVGLQVRFFLIETTVLWFVSHLVHEPVQSLLLPPSFLFRCGRTNRILTESNVHVHPFSNQAVFHQSIPFTASTLVVVVKGHRLLSIPHMLNQE